MAYFFTDDGVEIKFALDKLLEHFDQHPIDAYEFGLSRDGKRLDITGPRGPIGTLKYSDGPSLYFVEESESVLELVPNTDEAVLLVENVIRKDKRAAPRPSGIHPA